MEHSYSERAVFFFFLFLFFVALLLAGKLIIPFLGTIVLGFVFTGISIPLYSIFLRKLRPSFASGATCVILFLVVFVPAIFFMGVISKEAYDLYLMGKDAVLSNQLMQVLKNTHILERVNSILATMGFHTSLSWDALMKPVSEFGRVVGLYLFQQASFIASNVFQVVFYFCLMLIVVFYLLIDGNSLIEYIYKLSPLPREDNEILFKKFSDMAGAILVGNGLGGLIQGVLGGAVFFMFGLDAPFLWGIIMGFLAFLPVVGIGAVLIPTSMILILKHRIGAGIFMLVFYGVLSLGIEYIFKPKIVGDRVKMHPLVIFFAVLGGLKIYGILGIIYGPLIATLFLTLADIYFANFQILIEPEKFRG